MSRRKVKFSREERHALAIAKRKGLVRKSAKPSRYYKALLKQQDMKDAIEGRSAIVKVWHGFSRVVSEMFGGRKVSRVQEIAASYGLKARSGKIIIPKSRGKIIYNANTGRLQRYTIINGRRQKLDLSPSNADYHSLENQGYSFRINFAQGTAFTWDSAYRMIADMEKYESTGFKNWREWVTLIRGTDEDEE